MGDLNSYCASATVKKCMHTDRTTDTHTYRQDNGHTHIPTREYEAELLWIQ